MKKELGIGYCGLICALCSSNNHCKGCKSGECPSKESCKCFKCCQNKGYSFCYECEEFPCVDSILRKPRIHMFCSLVETYGEDTILECLEENEKAGIQYHYPNQELGDYDNLSQIELEKLVLKNKK